MDAPTPKSAMPNTLPRVALWIVLLIVGMGARQRTANFIVETADPRFAEQVAQASEMFRRDLAIEWLGQAMPNWSQPCVMTVQAGPGLGAGGATTFVFDRGEVFGWRMSIQGSQERLLDSVLPHEITHMIFASHFRQPLPRWADEGGATSVEHASERTKHRRMLDQFLRTGRGIAFNQMFAMTEYPQDIMPLYAQGFSLADYLIQNGGRRKFMEFLGDGLKDDDWPRAIEQHYGIRDLSALQNTWLAWVKQGSPQMTPRGTEAIAGSGMLASDNSGRRPRPEPNLIYRVRDKQSNESTPLASLVPVRLPSNPSPSPQHFASNRPDAKVLPANGWRAPGMASPPPVPPSPQEVDPSRVQVASPQGEQQPGQ